MPSGKSRGCRKASHGFGLFYLKCYLHSSQACLLATMMTSPTIPTHTDNSYFTPIQNNLVHTTHLLHTL